MRVRKETPRHFGKRALALFLSLVMALSLVQITAFAADDDPLQPDPVENVNNDDINLSKTAERVGADTWEVTVRAEIGEQEIEQQPLEVVFVLDRSGSMAWCTDAEAHNAGSHTHNNKCYELSCEQHEHTWSCYTQCTVFNNRDHWEEGKYGLQHIQGTDCIEGPYGSYYFLDKCPEPESTHKHEDDCYQLICGKTKCKHTTNDNAQCWYVNEDGETVYYSTRLAAAKDAINTMVNSLPDGKAISYVTFSSNAKVEDKGLDGVNANGGTNIMAGVDLGIKQFSKSSVSKKILVLVSDGEDNNNNYSSDALTAFDGTVFTVGFALDNPNLAGMAKNGGTYMYAGNTDALNSAFDQIKTRVTAMVVDPMGEYVSYNDDAQDNGTVQGVLKAVGDTLYWLPKDETEFSNQVIEYTYTVKLNDSAPMTGGVHNNIALNNTTYLQYGIESGGDVEAKSAEFPMPKATYEVGTLQVMWQYNGSNVQDATGVERIITDWDTPAFKTKWEIQDADKQISAGGHNYYSYVDTTITKNDDAADSVAATADEYIVIHNYKLVEMYSVSYAYTGDVPEDAPGVSDWGGLEEAGTPVEVEAEPTSEKYVFSGWTTSDAAVADGSFTMPYDDVKFVGSWTIKPSYKVQANYFTITDGVTSQDNDEPIGLTVEYTTEETASYTILDSDYNYDNTYTSVELADGSVGTLSSGVVSGIIPNAETAVVTLNFYRTVKSPATYVVNHEYNNVAPDGNVTSVPADSYTLGPVSGEHGDVIRASNINRDTTGHGHHGLGYYEEDSRTGDITLDKDYQQEITITYNHYQYRVTTSGDAGVATLTPTAPTIFDKGQNAYVTFSLNPGYRLVSVTDNGVDVTSKVEDNMYAISNISANHAVVVTTEKIPYTLTVQYLFADGNKPATGFEDYTDTKYYGESYEATEIAAPAGYTRTDSGNTSGTITGDVTVIYLYVPNDRASVTVYYVDADTGMHLLMPQTDTGLIGTGFDMSAHKKDSITIGSKIYDLVNKNEVMTGTYVKGGTNIYLKYRERTTYTVTVNYVSENSKVELTKASYTETKYKGSTYDVSSQIPGTIVDGTGKTWYYSGDALATGDDFSGTLDGNKTITVKYYLKPTWSVLATYYTVVNGKPDTDPLTASANGTGEVGSAVPFDRSEYDTQYGFSASNFNNDLKVNSKPASEMPTMEKFGTYAVTLSYTKTVNNPVSTTVNHEFRTTLDGVAIADTTTADPTTFNATWGTDVDMAGYSKAGQTGYEGYTVEGYTPAQTIKAGTSGTIKYLRELVTVVFDLNGGTWNDSADNIEYQVVKGTALNDNQPVPTPTKSGYTFDGWTASIEGATVNGIFTQRVVFTAQWSSNSRPSSSKHDVIVNYFDQDTGKKIADSYELKNLSRGDKYDVTDKDAIEIEGYTYVKTIGDELSGTMGGSDKVINVYYVKDTEIVDPDVPLTPLPEEPEVEIPEEEVPLAEAPETGDISALWMALTALSGTGLAGLAVLSRKKREDEE